MPKLHGTNPRDQRDLRQRRAATARAERLAAKRQPKEAPVPKIYKFTLALEADQWIDAAVVRWLGVGFQAGALVVWAEVMPGEHMRTHLAVRATGDDAPEAETVVHVGSAQLGGEGATPFVMHVYQLLP